MARTKKKYKSIVELQAKTLLYMTKKGDAEFTTREKPGEPGELEWYIKVRPHEAPPKRKPVEDITKAELLEMERKARIKHVKTGKHHPYD